MKQWMLLGCFLISLGMYAQEDARYLTGAVPVEDGKVVFSRSFEEPVLSKNQLFDMAHEWLANQLVDENSRIVLADRESGNVVLAGSRYLVFSSSLLSLDRSLMSYRFIAECNDGACKITINGIKYEYNVSYQKEPERYTAEEWITDKYALNKGKLIRITGKFRKATIDFVDETFDNFSKQLAVLAPVRIQTQAVQAPAVALQPATPVVAKAGYTTLQADQLPATILDMLDGNRLELGDGKDKTWNSDGVVWKGTSTMFGRQVAMIALPEQIEAYRSIGADGVFTVAFRKNTDDEMPWLLMECRKQGETTEGGMKTILSEVLHVWIK